MSLIKFEILNKVAEVKSFTQAAEVLGLTQSAVSHAITNLETEFGFPLVNRNRLGISLTSEGEILLLTIRKVLHYYEQVQQEAASIAGLTKGTIKVGVFTSVSTIWLPEIIKLMQTDYPDIRIELMEGNYFEIEQWLLGGVIDCGFINVRYSQKFDVIPLKDDRLLCIVSDKSELYNNETISFKELEKQWFIMPAFGGYHDVKRIFKENKVQPKIRFELMGENAIMSMVANLLGISILPEMVLQSLLPQLRAIPLEVDSYRSIGLATRYNLSPAARKFAEVTKSWVSML
ncbi:LysR family transcriptional regulator [Bacillus sp. BA3]|uniref:LysR family transcriptional regulator n=1 Tax=Bacillus sp. BA3 TaxID=2057910 RepID=UPI000C33545F|nr:LysR family transcriptional regulator [Bacillus sp. BA3]PKF86006.1 LysR family transcriptional regulator [Bacillus sp. BA3]